jgi:hypothetical protein
MQNMYTQNSRRRLRILIITVSITTGLLFAGLYYYFSNKYTRPVKNPHKEAIKTEGFIPSDKAFEDKIHSSKREYKVGIIYIWESNETYNPNWLSDLSSSKQKIESALNEIFKKQGKKFDVDFLGEFKAENLCWNPSKIAFILENSYYPNSIEKGSYRWMPGSQLTPTGNEYDYLCFSKNSKILWLDCPPTRCEEFTHPSLPDDKCFKIKCDNKYFTLAMENQEWVKFLLEELGVKFNLSDYDFKLIILGKAGPIIPQTGDKEKHFFDNVMTAGEVMGYYYGSGVIVMTENGLRIPSYYHRTGEVIFTKFFMPGWQQVVHEILHYFGAVDVYPPPLFEQNPHREKALKLEPESEVDKSIMANGWAGYCNKYAYHQCTPEYPEKIYIDKYNRIKLGLE